MTDTTPTPEPSEHTGASEATFGMKKAAQVAGVSVSTIRRHKDLLRQYGAVIEPGGWKVPMSALIASGLMRPQTPPLETQSEKQPITTEHHDELNQLRMEVQELRHRAELAEERQRSAEQRAQDARELADSLSETLTIERRMLTTGWQSDKAYRSDRQPEVRPEKRKEAPSEEKNLRGGWRRFLGL